MSIILREGQIVGSREFCQAFITSDSLEIVRLLCTERIDAFKQLTTQDYEMFFHRICNKKNIMEFLLSFMVANDLEASCCAPLFRVAASRGYLEIVERIFEIFPTTTLELNDKFINDMFKFSSLQNVECPPENLFKPSPSSFANVLKLIVTNISLENWTFFQSVRMSDQKKNETHCKTNSKQSHRCCREIVQISFS